MHECNALIRLTVVPPQSLTHQSQECNVQPIRLTVTWPQSPTHQTDVHMTTKSNTADRLTVTWPHKVQHIRTTVTRPRSPTHQTDSHETKKSNASDWPNFNATNVCWNPISQPTSTRMAFSIRDSITKHFPYVFKLSNAILHYCWLHLACRTR